MAPIVCNQTEAISYEDRCACPSFLARLHQDLQRLIRWMSSDPRMIDVEGRLEEMNKWGIDMQILSVPFHGALVQDREVAVELAKMANDVVVQAARNHPNRFRVFL